MIDGATVRQANQPATPTQTHHSRKRTKKPNPCGKSQWSATATARKNNSDAAASKTTPEQDIDQPDLPAGMLQAFLR